MNNNLKNYDIIGDIHGCSLTLEKLLSEKLGYKRNTDGTYHHIDRQAIFLGDFIDRGPHQKEVISIVRPMIESGTALSVMGNHEFNAIAYHAGLREHNEKNDKQHKAFLDAYLDDEVEYADVINWFKSLPLWLDMPDIRIIHACWDKIAIKRITDFQYGDSLLSDKLLIEASREGSQLYEDVELILKGKEVRLPEGCSFKDKDGNTRHDTRIRWWDNKAKTYREAFMGPESARKYIPDEEIIGDHSIEYLSHEPPVFLGHYWFDTEPEPLTNNIACIDYSIAKADGNLVAYQWDGKKILEKSKFVTVSRLEM